MAAVGAANAAERRQAPALDWGLILATVVLLTFGLMSLFSEGVGRDGLANFRRQVISTLVGIGPFLLFYFAKPTFWRRSANGLYILSLLLLGATLVLGKDAKGAQRWIDVGPIQFQPSEIAKLLVVLTLSAYYANRLDRMDRPSTFLLGLAHVAVPMAFILKQPSLTAAMVVLAIWFGVSLLAGIPARYFATAVAAVAMLGVVVFAVPPVSKYLLHGYQQDRIEGLLRRSKDAKGEDWQSVRAEIAFGVGGVYGSGFLRGQQKEGNFIPEQRNDFVFTVVGEEGGLVGCTLALGAYAFFFWRVFLILAGATEPYERFVVGGVFALLATHTVVNLAMVLHLLPVAGLWLPFMSSGGTAIWLCLACVGLLLNIRRREKPVLF